MLISRDPFARSELHSERVYLMSARESCAWCGDVKRTPKARRPYLLSYRTESDGGRTFPARGLFCSAACFRTYNE